jgi:hypothetical protein
MKDTEKNELLLKGIIANLDQELIKHYEKDAWQKVVSQTTIGNDIKFIALQYYDNPSLTTKKYMVKLLTNNVESEIIFETEKYLINPEGQMNEFIDKLGHILVQQLVNSNEEIKFELYKSFRK